MGFYQKSLFKANEFLRASAHRNSPMQGHRKAFVSVTLNISNKHEDIVFNFRNNYVQILHQSCFLVVDTFSREKIKGKYPHLSPPITHKTMTFMAFVKPTINPIVQNLFATGIELVGTQFPNDI